MLKSDWLEAWHRALVIKHSRGQQPSPHTGTMAAAVTAAAEAAAAAARGLHPPHHLGAVVRPLDRARPMQVFRRRHADERGVVRSTHRGEVAARAAAVAMAARIATVRATHSADTAFLSAPACAQVTWEEEDEQGGVVLHGPAEVSQQPQHRCQPCHCCHFLMPAWRRPRPHPRLQEQLRSLISSRDAYVRFVNGTPHNVRLLWLNYRGEEVRQ